MLGSTLTELWLCGHFTIAGGMSAFVYSRWELLANTYLCEYSVNTHSLMIGMQFRPQRSDMSFTGTYLSCPSVKYASTGALWDILKCMCILLCLPSMFHTRNLTGYPPFSKFSYPPRSKAIVIFPENLSLKNLSYEKQWHLTFVSKNLTYSIMTLSL